MAEQNTRRTEEPSDGNNSQNNANDNLVRMLEKTQESSSTILPQSRPKH